MRYRIIIATALVLGVAATVGVATVGLTSEQPFGPPIGPRMAHDTGAGELLVVVLGGVFETREEAEAANEQMVFGDVQGYYVVPVGQFQGFEQGVGEAGEFALVSAFRTEEGAQGFAELAASFGYAATILPERVRSLGGVYAGLGQEAHPDGSGPLLGPIEESLP
jgi:hypothetical protein